MENEINEKRRIRGYAIISKGDTPEIIGEGIYIIPSQSGAEKYTIQQGKRGQRWTCTCKDFSSRGIDCKHICAVRFWLKMREKINSLDSLENDSKTQLNCPYCNSETVAKNGKRRNRECPKQKFKCLSCKRVFVEQAYKYIKVNPQIITLIMDLYYKGLSLRKIKDNLRSVFGVTISHVAIYGYVRRYTKLIDQYVNQFSPKVSERWHADEQFVKTRTGSGDARGNFAYAWNVLDSQTRFLIASKLTQYRSRTEARNIMAEAREKVSHEPKEIITDKLRAYREAIRQSFPNTVHYRYKGFKDNPQNNRIERFHGTFRERDKVLRGLKSVSTGELFINGFRNYYNFVRPHSAIGNLTPAEMAEICLNLGENKWEGIIRLSAYRK